MRGRNEGRLHSRAAAKWSVRPLKRVRATELLPAHDAEPQCVFRQAVCARDGQDAAPTV